MRKVSLLKLSGVAVLALLFNLGTVSPVPATQPLETIQLDNGILLRDWIEHASAQSAQSPLETGERAVTYIKRYGPYRELLDIVWKATRSAPFEEQSITAENAAQKLAELDMARAKLGEWPQLLISHAVAASLSGKPDAALADLQSWLKVVPIDDKRRREIVALVIDSEKDSAAVARYFNVNVTLTLLASYFKETTEALISFNRATNILVTKAKAYEATFQYEICSMPTPFKPDVKVQWKNDFPIGTPSLTTPCRAKKIASNGTASFNSCWFEFASPQYSLERMKVGNNLNATRPSLDAARAEFLKKGLPQVDRFQQAFEALIAAQCK